MCSEDVPKKSIKELSRWTNYTESSLSLLKDHKVTETLRQRQKLESIKVGLHEQLIWGTKVHLNSDVTDVDETTQLELQMFELNVAIRIRKAICDHYLYS